jgi:general secretion pathway protein G
MVNIPKKGFTLIEIMLVVIIIGVLVAMVVPNIAGKSEQARMAAARTDIEANIGTALDLYLMDVGRYPTTEQSLGALASAPSGVNKWNGPYLKKKKLPKDPWGREYVYKSPGDHNKDAYDLYSLGNDGKEGVDDVTNWEEK